MLFARDEVKFVVDRLNPNDCLSLRAVSNEVRDSPIFNTCMFKRCCSWYKMIHDSACWSHPDFPVSTKRLYPEHQENDMDYLFNTVKDQLPAPCRAHYVAVVAARKKCRSRWLFDASYFAMTTPQKRFVIDKLFDDECSDALGHFEALVALFDDY